MVPLGGGEVVVAVEEPYVGEIFAEIVGAGRESGDILPGISSACVGNVLRDLCLGALHRWSQRRSDDGRRSLDGELQAIPRLLVHGIASGSAARASGPSGGA